MRYARLLAATAVVLTLNFGVLLSSSPEVAADGAASTGITIPKRGTSGTFWDGTHVYMFGGAGVHFTDEIVRYNPLTHDYQVMEARLPYIIQDSPAIWDGTDAYIFGGFRNDVEDASNQILRYNPATDTISEMEAVLPDAVQSASAVWDGSNAYIFGGFSPTGNRGRLDTITRYHPGSDTVTLLNSVLPSPRAETTTIWDGLNVYVFGGCCGHDDIVRFNPTTGAVTVLAATINEGGYQAPVWTGSIVYLFGGGIGSSCDDSVLRFDPATSLVTTMDATLPFGYLGVANVIWLDGRALLLGGACEAETTAEIVVYDPIVPDDPPNFTVASGPGEGVITLSWDPPHDVGVTGYRVYRGDHPGQLSLHAELGTVTTYADTGLASGSLHFYRVSAVAAVGEGLLSPELQATTFLECVETTCVGIPLIDKIATVVGPNTTILPEPTATVEVELGNLRVQVGELFSEQAVVLAKVNGEPSADLLTKDLGGVSTHYETTEEICVTDPCKLVFEAEPSLNEDAIGELWTARFQIWSGSVKLTDQPFVGFRSL